MQPTNQLFPSLHDCVTMRRAVTEPLSTHFPSVFLYSNLEGKERGRFMALQLPTNSAVDMVRPGALKMGSQRQQKNTHTN